MTQQYNAPPSTPSSVGTQFNTHYWDRVALIEARREQYFGQLADVTSMPKNMGKTIKKYHYIPLLDAQNINDQGIDAAGVTIDSSNWYVRYPSATLKIANASKGTAASAINDNIDNNGSARTLATAGLDDSAGTGFANITLSGSLTVKYLNATKKDAALALNLGAQANQASGNLYGSSKDIGYIPSKLPLLSENAGKVNRVGFKRKDLEGTFENFGFFSQYSKDSLNFDTDADLMMHLNRETLNAAMKITEDALMVDLITNAGVIRYTGNATNNATLDETDTLTYKDLQQLSIDLDNNRCPKQTTIITGTRLIDTKVIPACRVAYCGSELIPTLEAMEDLHSNPAWNPVESYAAGTTVLNGERGRIGDFRFVIVPDMVKYSGQGGASNAGTHYETNGKLDVLPILVVGEESFTTIGFNTDGKSSKFKTIHKKPDELYSNDNPYGKTGFMSIEWYYGFMLLRGERIALIKTVGVM